VAEALGHRGDGDASREHLGGHEMAQVVKPEVRKARGTPGGDEPLGQPVGQSRPCAVVTRAEHERADGQRRAGVPRQSLCPGAVRHQHVERFSVELHSVRAVGLGRAELGAVGGPSIRARVKAIAARSSSTSPHRRASSWLRRAPVDAASLR